MTPISFLRSALMVLMAISATAPAVRAEDQPYLAVGKAKTKKSVVAIPDFRAKGSLGAAAGQIEKIVQSDLAFTDMFAILGKAAYTEKAGGIAPGSFDMMAWTSISTDYLVKAEAQPHEKGMVLEAYLYSAGNGQAILSKRYVASLGDLKTVGHSFANDIVTAITGLPGIFKTKISMVCDRSGRSEVYVMDFDGSNVKQITHHRSTVFSPAWSPDGTRIAYSLIAKNKKNIKNTNLYEFSFRNSSIRLLSDRKGMNSGANYHPDGQRIALTMSFLGEPEIFIFNPEGKNVTRLTKSAGVNVDPSFSPDGKQLTFVSSRAGPSMVYKMDSDGSNVQRLTFAGKYNASPSWSPLGKKIAFAGWIDRGFDIFTMNSDGTTIERLTKNQGTNEDPDFSPDGNFITFASSRSGGSNIYVMNVEGTFVKRLTYGIGKCVSPKWSKPPQD